MEIKMNINVEDIELNDSRFECDKVTILPVNFYESDEKYQYSSTSISFWKYANSKIKIDFLTEPELLVEQRSAEWFGPAILLTSFMLTENPQIISILCGVISNYLSDFYKSIKKPTIKLKVLYKETKSSKTTEISYEGDLTGMDRLEASILKIAEQGKYIEK